MSYVLPQVALHRVIQEGIMILKQNPAVLDTIFAYYNCPPMENDYGQAYIEKIKTWLVETKIPTVQAWSIDPQQVPQISVKLATEQEDESKGAMGDHFDYGLDAQIGTQASLVNLDVAIRASKNGDQSLWLYYMVIYILSKRKRSAESLGLELHTWSATDYVRDADKLVDNVWTRYIRFRCIVQNYWEADPYIDIDDVEVCIDAESVPGGDTVDL